MADQQDQQEKPADPDTSHLASRHFQHVYEPAEDTYLLMDAAWEDRGALRQLAAPVRFLEMGCGSGVVTAYFAAVLGRGAGLFFGSDVNPHAARAASATLRRNGVPGGVVLAPFASAFRGRFDVVVFNPPYVPTPREEMEGDGIERSWAGGERGREVLDQVLPRLGTIVAPGGLFYLVTVRENDPAEIAALLAAQGFSHELINERKAGREFLQVHRFRLPAA